MNNQATLLDINGIVQEVTEVTHKDLLKELSSEIVTIQGQELRLQLEKEIVNFKNAIETYQSQVRILKENQGNISYIQDILTFKKDQIYSIFFKIQNLVNLYMGQKVIITHVDVDENGRREIKIVDNDISHLGIEQGMYRNNPYYKLSYVIDNNYRILKNELTKEKNEGLQNTAMEVERRFDTYKKRVLWKPSGKDWMGYQFRSKGPINEAYASFYIAEVIFQGYMEDQIHKFIMDPSRGAIAADNFSGFMVGDYSQDGIQYAIKGKFGGPQGWIQASRDLQKVLSENFSEAAWNEFIKKYTQKPEGIKSQITELSKRKIQNTSKKLEQEIIRDLTF